MADRRPVPLLRDMPRLALLALIAVAMAMPYIWMISTSLKPLNEIFGASLSLIPHKFYALENYGKVFSRMPVFRYLLNGAIVCGSILFFQLLFAVPAGYALAKLRFRGQSIVFGAVMLGLLVPVQATSLPLYAALASLHLLDTYTALIAPFTISVFAIFMFRQFFRAMPNELLHAARLDGMGELEIVWRVMLPNAWPAATAFAIFSVVAHWNDLYWPMIVISQPEHSTPALGVMFFRSVDAGDDFGALMATAVVMTAPLVIAFLFAQRRFVEGIATTGLKG
jgi:multiple sugar transport system permease protein